MGSTALPHGSAIIRRSVIFLLVAAGLYAISRQSFLLFHTLIEIFSVTMAGTIFAIGWNSRRFNHDTWFVFLAVAYLTVGILDLLHTLTYKGMSVMAVDGANTTTQLWIATRVVEAVSFLAAAVIRVKKAPIRSDLLFGGYFIVATTLIGSIIVKDIFPRCYVDGVGLTLFKVFGEYVVIAAFAMAGWLFWRQRTTMSNRVNLMLLGAIIATILAEFAFILYTGVYDFINYLGHILRLAACLFVYQAFIYGSLRTPYESIFRTLSKERALLQGVLEHLPSGVIVAEAPSGKLLMENAQATKILDWYKHHSQMWPLTKAITERLITKNKEIGLVLNDGTIRTLSTSASPVHDESGELVAGVAVVDDITERKEMEAALRQAEADRLEAQARFIQVAAHELRNPMTALKGVCTLMDRRVAAGKPVGELPMLVNREIDRLSAMLDEVLEAFRVQRGHLELIEEPVDVGDVIDKALLTFKAGDSIGRFNIMKPPEKVWVLGDARRLEDVLRNIIGNAVKYSLADTPIDISVYTNASSVTIKVQDRGMGIPHDQLKQIFNEFFRASNVTKGGPSGLGLGLYICAEIVQRHGGKLWAESAEGQGSAFYTELSLYHPSGSCNPTTAG